VPRRFLHIAVGVLRRRGGEVLVCRRPAHKLYPGEWEFPGGKVERGEKAASALRRELREELGIEVRAAAPLIRLRHEYPELAVDLDTWSVTAWDGTVRSTEHPAIAWVQPEDLPRRRMLAADRPIVNALRLPPYYVFTPAAAAPPSLAHPPRSRDSLLRLRLPQLPAAAYRALARRLAPRARVLVDRAPSQARHAGLAGFHATSAVLRRLERRPVAHGLWFAASCHDAGELALARRLGADFAVLGPVRATPSHPGGRVLGWRGFEKLARAAGIPVYAIGGLGPADLEAARRHGAQGVAGISAFWDRAR
jgi:8-oxo-dGTP diphosphatase